MKTILAFVALLLVPFTSQANLVVCNWDGDSSKSYRCNGQNYVYRPISCSYIPEDQAFCHERKSGNVTSCMYDEDPQTQECMEKFFAIHKEELDADSKLRKARKAGRTSKGRPTSEQLPEEVAAEQCHWKEPGIAYHVCEGETFAFGHLSCQYRGVISNLFCKAIHENSVEACRDDNDPKTHRCLKALKGMRAKKSANPEPAAASGAIQ